MIDVDKKINHGEFFSQIKEVYSYFEDETSKNLFNARLLASHTNQKDMILENASPVIKKAMQINKENEELHNKTFKYNLDLNVNKEEVLILYGANEQGKRIYNEFHGKVKKILFCDIDSDNIKEFCEVPVISLIDLVKNHKNSQIIVSDYYNHLGIYDFTVKYNLNIVRSTTPIVIYGIHHDEENEFAKRILQMNYSIVFYADIKEKEFMNYPVISKEELIENYKNHTVFIETIQNTIEIYDFLKEKGFKNVGIDLVMDLKGQYFDEVIKLTEDEIFVDAGVFDGSSSIMFAKKCNNKYKKIILCEPNKDIIPNIAKNISHLENTELLNVGLWNKKEVLKFQTTQSKSSYHISDSGDLEIEVDKLDDILNGDEVTFIKMDIEGAELNALKGASETIKKYKPKLAISIYHKDEDIIEIPAFIKSLVPEYKMYIRHYSNQLWETILYAVL